MESSRVSNLALALAVFFSSLFLSPQPFALLGRDTSLVLLILVLLNFRDVIFRFMHSLDFRSQKDQTFKTQTLLSVLHCKSLF